MEEKELDIIINKLTEKYGGNSDNYYDLMNQIAYHESAGTLDTTLQQYGGGPGRGKYQFEMGENAGGKTAANRAIQYYKENNIPIPQWLVDTRNSDSLDVSTLTSDQQDVLFLTNMAKHPKANFSDIWQGEQSVEDFWADYHWAGEDKDREERIKSFRESQKKLGVPINDTKYNKQNVVPMQQNEMQFATQPQDNTFVDFPEFKSNTPPSQEDINNLNFESPIPEAENPQPQQAPPAEEKISYTDWIQNYLDSANSFAMGGKISNCGGIGQPPCPPETKVDNTRVAAPLKTETFKFESPENLPSIEEISNQYIKDREILDRRNENKNNAEDKTKEFLLDYIKSSKYRELLEKGNYDDIDEIIEQRYKNVSNADIMSRDGGTRYDSWFNNVKYDERQIDMNSFDNTLEDLDMWVSHELAHSENRKNDLSDTDKKKLTSLLKSNIVNRKDLVSKGQYKHNNDPYERKADFNALKYFAKKHGIYDPFKEDFTEEHLKQLLKIDDGNSEIINRVQQMYENDAIIYLMNEIASNSRINNNINFAALGGLINNNSIDEKFNEFNEGGTHEENPYGGIPMGMGDNGLMNTVEEGETSYDFEDGKYIFSNRIKL